MSSTGAGALRVCVIGAGAAGLCACRHLSGHDLKTFVPTVYEQTDNVGGTWVSIELFEMKQ
jgi:cation diffusion facilitator CzcD-associated flavoprotein CzcO